MHIHFLNRLEGADHEVLRQSVLASDRLRTLPALLGARSLGWNITSGETVANATDLVVVSKIGGWEIDRRETAWLSEISLSKRTGARIAVDYTDHHLASASAQSSFYRRALELADQIIVPSNAMKNELHDVTKVPISIVEDRLEYPPIPPKAVKEGANTALWFGHESNIEFLSNLIDTWPEIRKIKTLLVVSGKGANSLLTSYPYRERPTVNVQCLEWSPQALVLAARQADVALIPSDTSSHKQFASSNRLVTSLALGLPTLATTLASYREFQDCFTDLSSPQAQQVLAKPEEGISGVKLFQEKYLDRFTDAAITECWRTTLSSLLS
jgi:hypothetical protein